MVPSRPRLKRKRKTLASSAARVEHGDDTLVPCSPIPWDRTIIKYALEAARLDHKTRLIFSMTGEPKGIIFIDVNDMVMWWAVDGDYMGLL
jgi:hypothetical protein